MSDRVGGCGGSGPNLNGQYENDLQLRELQGNPPAGLPSGGIGESFRSTPRYSANGSPAIGGLSSRPNLPSLSVEQTEASSSALRRLRMITGHIIGQNLAPPARADRTPPGSPSADSQPAQAREQPAAGTRRVRFLLPEEGPTDVPQDANADTLSGEHEMRPPPSPTSPMLWPVEMNVSDAELDTDAAMANHLTSVLTFANTTEASRSSDFIGASSVEVESTAATDATDGQDFELLRQMDTREITVEKLEAELAGILAELKLVNEKANKIYEKDLAGNSRGEGGTLSREQQLEDLIWSDEQLQALHWLFECRLKKVHEYLCCSLHPVATEEMNNRPLENGVLDMLREGIVPIIRAYEKMPKDYYEMYWRCCLNITTTLIEEIPRFHALLSNLIAVLHESSLNVGYAGDEQVMNAIRWRAANVILRGGRLGSAQIEQIDWSQLRSENGHELLGTIFTETYNTLRRHLSSDEHFQKLFDEFLNEVA